MGPTNGSSNFVDSNGFQGVSVLELLSKPSKLQGVHYVTGSITFQDLFDNEREHARLRIEGVYVWPFRQLRMVANSGGDGPFSEEEYFRSNPYHLLGMFSNQVYPDPLKGNNGDKNGNCKKYFVPVWLCQNVGYKFLSGLLFNLFCVGLLKHRIH
jgi:hypothetical protein